MPSPIDPLVGPKFVLEGRIVTMGAAGVIDDGAIYIAKGEIVAVQDTGDSIPDGFADAPVVRTGDTLYPGLIELHNHLSYNAMPLWDVPRKYTNNGQWKGHDDYKRLITKPSQVLGQTDGVVEALVRFVECRAVLGGTTTSQGITLAEAGGIQRFYRGLVRNVEKTDELALPRAETRIANPKTNDQDGYLAKLKQHKCYLQHLSEGTDQTARGWFLRLRREDETWALHDSLCGIHCAALQQQDLKLIAKHGGSMVWSPLSNYLLYGATVDLTAAKKSGITMALGCDWAPSGSKNLLGELKIAWLASEDAGGVFTHEDLVKMVTINPAQILGWSEALGSIEAGKRADIVAINGSSGNVYENLVMAKETSLTLVVINGVPRLGQPRLMAHFAGKSEEIEVGRSTRILHLDQDTADPVVGNLTLKEASTRLSDAMTSLPALAQDVDRADAGGGVFSGSLGSDGVRWKIDFEFDQEPDEAVFTGASLPYADWVVPMDLDPITLADDGQFLRRLMAARNLPESIKLALPALYGQSIPIPADLGFVRDLPLLAEARDLKTFLRAAGELSLEERLAILDQALLILSENYVHLPLKQSMHAVDPIQSIKLLRHKLTQQLEHEHHVPPEEELLFHEELASVFNSLRDLHTLYTLPGPFKGKVAWLPFLIEEFWHKGHHGHLVTKVVGQCPIPPGARVLFWNGQLIERAVAENARREAGNNDAARRARGLNSLTVRPLSRGVVPTEQWVDLMWEYNGEKQQTRHEWLLLEPGSGAHSVNFDASTSMGIDGPTDEIQTMRAILYGGDVVRREQEGERLIDNAGPQGLATNMASLLRAKTLELGDQTLGYLRIFSFNVGNPRAFVEEVARLLDELPPSGLIIDIRGNPGGHIHAAERLLQLFTPATIEPERAQLRSSDVNRAMCRDNSPSAAIPGLDLQNWVESLDQAVITGATYSNGYPITPPSDCNDTGQRYYGPVVLITDALCYSAADIFAAGFQDHRIGKLLGTQANTGAGGANVWSHSLLRKIAFDERYVSLPKGAGLRVAIRRTMRVGDNAGGILEDLGVKPNSVHLLTGRDVMEGNQDLLEEAARILANEAVYGLQTTVEGSTLHVATQGIAYLTVEVNGRPECPISIEENRAVVDLEPLSATQPMMVHLRGYNDKDELVAAWMRSLPQEP